MLIGETVTLRAPAAADDDFLYRVRNDFAVQNLLLALPRANSLPRVKNWFERILDDAQSVFFVVARTADDQPIGFIQLRKMDFVHGGGELGIYLDAAAHGKGAAAAAMRLLEDYVSGTFNLRKITLQVLAENARAVRFYEKLNFLKVGVFREHFYHDKNFHDVLIMEKFLIGKDKKK